MKYPLSHIPYYQIPLTICSQVERSISQCCIFSQSNFKELSAGAQLLARILSIANSHFSHNTRLGHHGKLSSSFIRIVHAVTDQKRTGESGQTGVPGS